jgi:hypothetical protein
MTWDATAQAEDIYAEWAALTFGKQNVARITPLITEMQTMANNAMWYHGYRGVWFKIGHDELNPHPLDFMTINESVVVFCFRCAPFFTVVFLSLSEL